MNDSQAGTPANRVAVRSGRAARRGPSSRPRLRSALRRQRGWRLPVPDPRHRKPKGILSFWMRARRLLWSWWPWALLFVWLMARQEWGWAIGSALMGLFSYLIAPAAEAVYGL